MADNMPLPDHITRRGGVLQYVRRVPEDLRDAFPFERVQRSLRTRDPRQARAAALDLDSHWDDRFAQARRARSLDADANGPAVVATEGWA